jgi:hypothetical protein
MLSSISSTYIYQYLSSNLGAENNYYLHFYTHKIRGRCYDQKILKIFGEKIGAFSQKRML